MQWHVTIDARLFNAAGIGTFLQSMLVELAASPNFTLTLLHLKEDREALLRYNHARLIPLKSSVFSVREQFELPLKIPKCDLFWSPHINVPCFPIRAKKRLTTIHDVFHLVNPQPATKRFSAQMLYKAACCLSDQVTTISEFSRMQILSYCGLPEEKLATLPLGVRDHFKYAPSEAIRSKYGLPEKYLLTISNGRWHKNLHRLKQACADLPYPLAIFGKGVCPVDACDLPALYSMATLFVFPSLYEGFGIPPLEAMACGCPVVTSRVASLPEVCGDGAAYVDPFSISSIREGIERVLSSEKLQQELREHGLERAQKLRATNCAAGHRELIESMLTP